MQLGLSRRAVLTAAAALSVVRPAVATGVSMRLRFIFADQSFNVALNDTNPARELYSMAPLALSFEDYSTNEKIAYLTRKLTVDEAGQFTNEGAGDVCYYAPWGNLALFYKGYKWSRGLVRLGRMEGSIAPLLTRGTHKLTVEQIS